jgi:hypothetical protein
VTATCGFPVITIAGKRSIVLYDAPENATTAVHFSSVLVKNSSLAGVFILWS